MCMTSDSCCLFTRSTASLEQSKRLVANGNKAMRAIDDLGSALSKLVASTESSERERVSYELGVYGKQAETLMVTISKCEVISRCLVDPRLQVRRAAEPHIRHRYVPSSIGQHTPLVAAVADAHSTVLQRNRRAVV